MGIEPITMVLKTIILPLNYSFNLLRILTKWTPIKKNYKKKSNNELSKSKLDEANKIANDIGAEDLKTLFKTI